MLGDSISTALIQKALDGTWQRQRAITNNIANHETPGYKSIRVSFESALDDEVKKMQGDSVDIAQRLKEIAQSKIDAYSDPTTSERADGNNVNLEVENIDMAKTQLQYQYLTRGMTDTFSRLRYAISEGKR